MEGISSVVCLLLLKSKGEEWIVLKGELRGRIMSKLSNSLVMLKLLSNKRKYSVKELAERLEVTERMVRVYKDDLEKAGIFIESIRGPYGGYLLNSDLLIPETGFSQYDILLLNEIYQLLKNNDEFKFLKEYEILRNKVTNIYKATKKKSVGETLQENNNQDKYNLLSRAIKEKKKVWLDFLSLNKTGKERIIHPCHLFLYNDEWYVSAFCELRGEIRHFSLSRIVNLEIKEESFKN